MAYRWRALRVRVMVGYVWRPGPDNSYDSAAVAAWVYSGAARNVALIPRPPGRFACGGSHCVARSRRRQPRFPSAPVGLPKKKAITPYRQRRLSVDHAAPRMGLTTASVGTVAQYTAHSAINATRFANCDPRW